MSKAEERLEKNDSPHAEGVSENPADTSNIDNDPASCSDPSLSPNKSPDEDDCQVNDHPDGGIEAESVPKHQRLTKSEKKRKRYEEKVAYQRERRKRLKAQQKAAKKSTNNDNELDNVPGEISSTPGGIPEGEASATATNLSKKQKLAEIRSKLLEAKSSGQRICIDLSLESHMSQKECSRLAQQLCRLYGSNRSAAKPAHLYFTGLDRSKFLYKECVRKNSGFENYIVDMTEDSFLDVFKHEDIVYLTPDSSDVLTTVDSEKVYVMGGLVDESVTKNITLSIANKANIATARLPIDEYMTKTNKAHSKVLSVNQVFDILLTFSTCTDWQKSLPVGVPPRKGYRVKDRTADCQQTISN